MTPRVFLVQAFFLTSATAQPADIARVFKWPLEYTWNAALQVAKEGFVADRISNDSHRLRLRVGPLRAYAFDLSVRDEGGGKTRVELALRARSAISAVRKEARRDAERYFLMLKERLEQKERK